MVQQTIQRICSGRDRHRKTDKTKTLKRDGWGLPSRSPERIRVGQSSLCSAGQEDWRPGRWLYLGWGQDWGTGQEGDAVLMASAQPLPCWALQGWGGDRRGLGSGKLRPEAKTEAATGPSRAGSLPLSPNRHAGGSSGLSRGTSTLRNSRFLSPLCSRHGEPG